MLCLGNGYDIYRQLKWQEIPKEKRDLFKKADKSKEKVSFAGNECRISKHNINDEWMPFEDALELKIFPCLSKLTLTRWHKNIYEYLQSTPFITELVLKIIDKQNWIFLRHPYIGFPLI